MDTDTGEDEGQEGGRNQRSDGYHRRWKVEWQQFVENDNTIASFNFKDIDR